ncbi:MAG: hypothetical protein EA427_00500 [Spirochaetaceae bacterium]|nr:MAG: hypothetical protein EA427_00500 [Spirochaetaceae bacterium]
MLAATAIALSACASLRPAEEAVTHPAFLPGGEGIFREEGPGPVEGLLQLPDRSHLVALEVISESEILLAYAPQSHLDRESARAHRISALQRLDPAEGTVEVLDPDGLAGGAHLPAPRYRDFRDRTPEEQTWFEGALVINPEEWERRYTFLLEGPEGSPALPVRLRAHYGRGPRHLDVTFIDPGSGDRQNWRIRLVTLDMERGVTPRLIRYLSAMRWDGERYVAFLDSIFDLEEGTRHRLVDGVPTTFVELVAVDEHWEHAAIVYGGTRVSREVAITPLALPAGHLPAGSLQE